MSTSNLSRRTLMKRFGVSAATAALVGFLPSLGLSAGRSNSRKQRFVIVFSPNGVVPEAFWPKETGSEFELPEILKPLEEFRKKALILHGVDNRVRGDGDDHMRGMSCLLTGIELFPGNIQGGGNTPAGWPRGLSIDQEIKTYFQNQELTRTRFGSLEFGVLVPHHADVWTRWVYTGANRPVAPISDPRQMFKKLYGDTGEVKTMESVLDVVGQELNQLRDRVSIEDRHLLEAHLQSIRETEVRLQRDKQARKIEPPQLNVDVDLNEMHYPQLSDVQQDLLVSAFKTDQTRIATLQYDKSVGNIRMKFLGIEEGHHELSHDPDEKKESVEKLIKIDRWYCEQIAGLARRLAVTPEPDGNGCLLDNTTIIWTNELGKGNSHTLNDIPFVLVGGGLGFKQGESLKFKHLAHNRLWISMAHALGHHIESFGNPELSRGGAVTELFG